jgi:signal transduction histidine kinase/ActR/RegA family two-component response regulator
MVIGVGVVVLAGWILDIGFLKSIVPGGGSMKPITAGSFILSGIAFRARNPKRTGPFLPSFARICTAVALLVGVLTLLEYAFGWDLGIDHLRLPERSETSLFPGRMGPNTALGFILLSGAILGVDAHSTERRRLAELCAAIVLLIGFMGVLGYVYGVTPFSRVTMYTTQMALHTSILFMVFAVGVLAARSDSWVVQTVVGDGPGSAVARRLIPLILLIPLTVGWLRLQAEHRGLITLEFGVAVVVLTNVVLLVVALLVSATRINRADAGRRAEELQVQTAREASRLKSEFLANMSHELRTPLNGIIGFAELMHAGKTGPIAPVHQEYLGDILTSARHLLQLINDVLDLSKVEAGKMEFRPEPVELTTLIREVNDILRTLAAQKQIRVEVEIDAGVTGVLADPGKLKQVLYNYLSNALKFTPEEGRVTVRILSADGNAFRLEVEDTGIGIKPEDLGRLFVEFQQFDASTAKKYPGTGLGLALTKRIVECQGGEVGVRSVVGQGSVFFAQLPRIARTTPDGDARLPPPMQAPHGSPRILIVEDDPADRRWLTQPLTRAGYAVDWVATGRDAIERFRQQRYDAITVDLLLPDVSGRDLLRALRSAGPNAATPVIVISVVTEHAVAAEFQVSEFLEKPVGADTLVASVRRALRASGRVPGSVA